MDRVIPFLAALVGLLALAGAVFVQASATTRNQLVREEIAAVRDDIERLAARVAANSGSDATAAADSGMIDAMLALQDRMNALEAAWADRPQPDPARDGMEEGEFASADGSTAIDAEWPTDDCIPIGTRFMASVGDELAICRSPVVVAVSAVTDDNVLVEDTGLITETAFKTIPGSNCRLTVFSADAAGFAEMRVSCN
jgi:hypothetical protein